jgi:hypothetical protein
MIDMAQPGMRKKVAVLTAIHRLRIEIKTGLGSSMSTLKAMQGWGFSSKRKASMLAELEAWMAEV